MSIAGFAEAITQATSTPPPPSKTLSIKPTHGYLTDISTGEAKDFLFNPAELEEQLATNWSMIESPGMSHKRPQFLSCENLTWKLTALFDQLAYDRDKPRPPKTNGPNTATTSIPSSPLGVGGPTEVEDWRAFLMSLMAPRRPSAGTTNRIAYASPTPVHFEWPGMISTTVRIKTATFKHTMFKARSVRPRIYGLELVLFEDPQERFFADEVRSYGTLRSWKFKVPSSTS